MKSRLKKWSAKQRRREEKIKSLSPSYTKKGPGRIAYQKLPKEKSSYQSRNADKSMSR